ncbi:MAG: DUF2085 domain-containing protein [Anaerolineae bacterium]|jgi:uncharacterized membrane protein|nr:DUF2085 domain-containing protein [Anaerolineae bacterium]
MPEAQVAICACIIDVMSLRIPRSDTILAAASLALVIALLLLAPHGLLDKADRAAYAVCHRIPERTFELAGRPLPLCARCSGLYLGAAAALLALAARGRGRAGRFPAPGYLLILGAFMLAWAGDGLNSFLALLDLPHLYEPTNRLRLVTGALAGISVGAVLLPALNVTFWRAPEDRRSVDRPTDLLWLLVAAATVVLLVSSDIDALLYPLALFSGVMVPLLLGLLFAMFYLALRRREGQAERWADLLAPLAIGLGAAFAMIAAIGLARDFVSARFGMPF